MKESNFLTRIRSSLETISIIIKEPPLKTYLVTVSEIICARLNSSKGILSAYFKIAEFKNSGRLSTDKVSRVSALLIVTSTVEKIPLIEVARPSSIVVPLQMALQRTPLKV